MGRGEVAFLLILCRLSLYWRARVRPPLFIIWDAKDQSWVVKDHAKLCVRSTHRMNESQDLIKLPRKVLQVPPPTMCPMNMLAIFGALTLPLWHAICFREGLMYNELAGASFVWLIAKTCSSSCSPRGFSPWWL